MPNVLYDPKKEKTPRTGSVGFDDILLSPGINELSEEQAERLKAHPDFAVYEESGAIAFISDKEAGKTPATKAKDPEAAKTTKSGNKPETEVQ